MEVSKNKPVKEEMTPAQIVNVIITDLKTRVGSNREELLEVASAEEMLYRHPDKNGKVFGTDEARMALGSFHKILANLKERTSDQDELKKLLAEEESLFRNSREI